VRAGEPRFGIFPASNRYSGRRHPDDSQQPLERLGRRVQDCQTLVDDTTRCHGDAVVNPRAEQRADQKGHRRPRRCAGIARALMIGCDGSSRRRSGARPLGGAAAPWQRVPALAIKRPSAQGIGLEGEQQVLASNMRIHRQQQPLGQLQALPTAGVAQQRPPPADAPAARAGQKSAPARQKPSLTEDELPARSIRSPADWAARGRVGAHVWGSVIALRARSSQEWRLGRGPRPQQETSPRAGP